jgi:multiple sugar transport system substrate-binding protein
MKDRLRMKRKSFRWLLVFVVCTLLVAGCGSLEEPGEAVTLTFAAWEYELPVYEPLAEKFMAINPSINVVVVPMEDMLHQEQTGSSLGMLRQIVAGADTAPAVGVVPGAFGSGLLMDLTPLMAADSSFDRADFYPGTLDHYATDGQVWVLPRTFHVQILAYNPMLFEQSGLPVPEAGWSWQELLQAAEQIAQQKDEEGQIYGFFDPSNGYLSTSGYLQTQGVDLAALDEKTVQLTDDPFVTALEQTRSLVDQGAIFSQQVFAADQEQAIDPQQLIAAGRVGIWDHEYSQMMYSPEGSHSSVPYDFTVGTVPYPPMHAGFQGGIDGYIISSGSRHPQQAWKWIEFLSRQQLTRPDVPEQVIPVSQVPARQALAERVGYWESLDEATAATYRWSLEHLPPFAQTPQPSLSTALMQALDQVLVQEQVTVEQALQAAQQMLDEQVAQAHMAATAEPVTETVVVATPEPQTAPEGALTISFAAASYNPSDLRQAVREFREQQPGIFVQLQPASRFSAPMNLADFAQHVDCFAGSFSLRGEQDAGMVRDLQPFIEEDPAFAMEDYPAPLLEQYRANGQLLGLPYAFTMRTLTYNQTAFAEAGIDPPAATWTPADFLAAANALTQGEGAEKRYGYVPLGMGVEDLFFFVRQFGGQLFQTNGDGERLQPDFTDPAVVEAIQWYIDLAEVHEVMPTPAFPYRRDDVYDDRSSYVLIQHGQAGMWFDYGYGMFAEGDVMGQPSVSQRSFDVALAPLPVGAGGLSSEDLTFASGLFIAAQAEHPQACWEWITFLSKKPSLARWSIPARMSVAQSEGFLGGASADTQELVEVYQATLEATDTLHVGPDYRPEYAETYWLFEAIHRAMDGEATLADALQEAEETTEAFLACVAEEDKPGSCARQVDADYAGYLEDMPTSPLP